MAVAFGRLTALACAGLLLGACSTTPILAAAADSLDKLASDWQASVSTYGPTPIQLAFRDTLAYLEPAETLQKQKQVFSRLSVRLARIDADALAPCDRIDHAVMTHASAQTVRRAELGLAFKQSDQPASDRLSGLAQGSQWYRFILTEWLGDDVTPDELFAFGERALARSVADYDAVAATLGFAGDPQRASVHLDRVTPRLTDNDATRRLFEDRQAQVWSQVAHFFPLPGDLAKATIARSDRGADFPAPGYYDASEATFFYNVLGEGYDPREADWLFLHEATPGHHYQFQYASHQSVCSPRIERPFNAAYAEGWAAYVETFGEQLGLYATPGAQLGAIEWDMIRSVRVVLDVAINDRGWTDAQALSYWHAHVRGQRDVALREIDRLKRWPGQAITYKYGAAVFESLKDRYLAAHPGKDAVVAFHTWALQYGPMPLRTLKQLADTWEPPAH